jgi:hypothetical protein
MLKTCLCFLKSEGPLNLKKNPSEQWQVISCRLIPLLTHVSFRCTVPLSVAIQRYCTFFSSVKQKFMVHGNPWFLPNASYHEPICFLFLCTGIHNNYLHQKRYFYCKHCFKHCVLNTTGLRDVLNINIL